MAGCGHDETAHVSGQDGCNREPCTSRLQGSQDGQTEGLCPSFAEGWKRVRHRSLGQGRRDQEEARLSPAGLSPEVCFTDEGQTTRPVRSEGTLYLFLATDRELDGDRRPMFTFSSVQRRSNRSQLSTVIVLFITRVRLLVIHVPISPYVIVFLSS